MKMNDNFGVSGTNVDAVKIENERSGLSYNEVKEFLVKTNGGHGTAIYSDTDVKEVRRKNEASMKD